MKLFKFMFVFLFAICLAGCLTNDRDTTTTTKFQPDGKTPVKTVVRVKESYLATTYKNLGLDIEVYAVAASFTDPTTGNMSPYIKLGIFKERYYSAPIVPGQPIVIIDEEYSSSWWNWTTFFNGSPDTKTNLIRRKIIYIGRATKDDKELLVKTGNGIGITISPNGVTLPKDGVQLK